MVIATLVLAIAASRWRVSGRVLLDLALTAVAALVVHHVVVMLSPIDNYEPTSAGELATDPGIEIALAVGRGPGARAGASEASHPRRKSRRPAWPARPFDATDRDPVIFSSSEWVQRRSTTALVACGVAPLLVGLVI